MKIDINGMLVEIEEGDRIISSWVAASKELYIQIWKENPKRPGVWDILAYEHYESLK